MRGLLIVFVVAALGQLVDADAPAVAKRPLWNDTWTDILKRDILMTYDKYARPSQPSEQTTLETSLNVLRADLDEDKSAFTAYAWYRMNWNDPKLRWNPADYGNLSVLHVSDHEIWQADVVLYNSATGSGIDIFGNTNCLVYPNGTVLWVPPAQIRSYCALDMRNWPFDEHNCTLIMGSWTNNALEVDLADTTITLTSYQENHQWAVKSTASRRMVKLYDCCVEPYVSLEYDIIIQRRSPMYKVVVVAPAFVVILMTLASFWLPAHSGEKILLNGVNILVVVSFLLYFAQKIPVLSSSIPLIVLFYSTVLFMLSISMAISVLVIQIAKNKHSRPVPWYIKKQLDGVLGSFLGLKRIGFQATTTPRSEELRDQNQTSFDDPDDQHIINNGQSSAHKGGPVQQYWIMFATAIDRVAFLVYFVFFLVLAIVYSV